jgi:hypothetical protein
MTNDGAVYVANPFRGVSGGVLRVATFGDSTAVYGAARWNKNMTLTASGTTITAITNGALSHGLSPGQWFYMAEADQDEYNGLFQVVSVTAADVFTYTATTAPTVTPATGTWGSAGINVTAFDGSADIFPGAWTTLLSKGKIRDVAIVGAEGLHTSRLLVTYRKAIRLLEAQTLLAPNAIRVMTGINDIQNGETEATVISRLKALFDEILADGYILMAYTIWPLNTSSDAQRAMTFNVNRWIGQYGRAQKFVVIEGGSVMIDPASATSQLRTGRATDTVHESALGAYYMGIEENTVLGGAIAQPSILSYGVQDNIGAIATSNNALGASTTNNGLMIGSGGTITPGTFVGLTGTAPTGWTVAGLSGSAAGTATVAVTARGDGYGNDIVIDCTAAINDSRLWVYRSSYMNSELVADSWYEWECYLTATSLVNVGALQGYITYTVGGRTYNVAPWAGRQYEVAARFPNGTYEGWARSGPFYIPSGTKTFTTPVIAIYWDGVGSGNLKIGRYAIRKITDYT